MLVPFGTDAPIYHRPIATVSIIVINVALFFLTGMGEVAGNLTSEHRWLILEFNRINPLQWITAAFMHAGWAHLIGNMIFLWCFGLIVEGKIGWKRFGWLYLGLCLAKGAITQIPMFLISDSATISGALGASGVIFALMAVALCWAPENDMHCLFTWTLLYIRPIDVPIFGFAFLYLVLQLLPLFFGGFHMSTPMLHLLGMSVGFPFAIYMLKHNLVDCEGWDIISRWKELPRDPLLIAGRLFRNSENRKVQRVVQVANDQPGRKALDEIRSNPQAYRPPVTTVPAPVAPVPFAPVLAPEDLESLPVAVPNPVPTPIPVAAAPTTPTALQSAISRFLQAIDCKDLAKATASFAYIQEQWGTHTMNDSLISNYAKLLSVGNQHIESLKPLKVLVSRRAGCLNEACLRIARIQLQLQQDIEAAKATLMQMQQPWSKAVEAKRKQIQIAIKKQDKSKRSIKPNKAV